MRTGSSIIILCALAGCFMQPADDEFAPITLQPGCADGFYTVCRVLDGDTIVLDNVGYLRFAQLLCTRGSSICADSHSVFRLLEARYGHFAVSDAKKA